MLKSKRMFLMPAAMAAFLFLSMASAWAYDDNKDFFNGTGQTVNDLHIVLDGVYNVIDVFPGYNPPLPGEHYFTNWSAWDDGINTYVGFDTPDSDILPGEFVHVGITTTNGPAKIIAAYLTKDGEFVAYTAVLSLDRLWLIQCRPRIRMTNTSSEPINLRRVQAALVTNPVLLGQLNTENLPPALQERGARLIPVTNVPPIIEPGRTIEFDLSFLCAQPGQFVILAFETSAPSNPRNRVLNFIQGAVQID